jgi:hypothetical protein
MADICELGYINDAREHGLISINGPPLMNIPIGRDKMLQFALTIDDLIVLRAHIDAFLKQHGVSSH